MNWIDIAATGTWTDMNGRRVNFTREFMDKIIAKFDPKATRRPPLVFGHPKTEDAAYGWIAGLQIVQKADPRNGAIRDVLQAKLDIPEKIRPAMNSLVTDHYPDRSIAVRDDGAIVHLGMLGAVAPAIEGLDKITALSDGDSGVNTIIFNFAEENIMTDDEIKALQEENAALKKTIADIQAMLEKLTAEKSSAEAALAAFRQEVEDRTDEARFCQLVKDERVLPAEKDKILRRIKALKAVSEPVMFAAHDGTQVKITASEEYWRELENRPKNGLLSEFASPEQAYQPTAEPKKQMDVGKL